MPIDPKKLHLLDPVLAWLDADAPHTADSLGFNMMWFRLKPEGLVASFNATDYADTACGSVCCIAGAVVEFNDLPYNTTITEVSDTLGMTRRECDRLFYGFDENAEAVVSLKGITPAIAAKTLRNFVATGEVVW